MTTNRTDVLAATLLLTLFSPATAQLTAIRAGRLIDIHEGTVTTDQVILVEGGKIAAIGPDVEIPDGADVIDLSDAVVLPGLFDCHTHLCYTVKGGFNHTNQGEMGFREQFLVNTLTQPAAYRALVGASNAREVLKAGFTTVRDVGNACDYADTALRMAVEDGLVPGPTIINAGMIISPSGGQFPGELLNPELPGIGPHEYLYADTRDDLRKAVRQNILRGARVIKLVVDDQPYIDSVGETAFVVAEAGAAGLKVAAHCVTEAGARHAIEGGVASVEHGFEMPDELLDLARERDVALVGTDFPADLWDAQGMPRPMAETRSEKIVDRLRRAHEAGVTIAFGTDVFFPVAGQTRGSAALLFTDSFREAGIPPAAILRAMTVDAARLLGVEGERGALGRGMAADLIATPGNPLEDIDALREAVFVMKDGEVVRDDR
ncbi:amidohydrolase family protein [Tautonia plasticadhaerens]|uniref:Imidazolonepropionase n=1 Tax=Tautonia plasticadhaerens TaxID=2527974 RepID=A0A518HEV5_9BACT|nr:amidohydrolase family protein [Tautonia plasticadhaerens]QDV39380.1 imidazolonepropionase [Tautonia plasticadhaerens]